MKKQLHKPENWLNFEK